jgi:hypothetical protein
MHLRRHERLPNWSPNYNAEEKYLNGFLCSMQCSGIVTFWYRTDPVDPQICTSDLTNGSGFFAYYFL